MASKYKLTGSPVAKAVKAVIYGPEGVGKTTLANRIHHAIFIDTEGSTSHMEGVVRYPRPQTWDELLDMVDDAGSRKVSTLVIDTLDWADILCTRSLCKEKKWDSIEAAGYGKGYVMLGEKFAELLERLNQLVDKGINVVFCAHAQLRKIEKPEETGAFDHWELKCSKRVAPLVKEWCDLLLFLNYDSIVIHGSTPMEANRITGNKRVMYANHQAVFDAKNRFGLPDKMPLDYEPIRFIFERGEAFKALQAGAQTAPAQIAPAQTAPAQTAPAPEPDKLPDFPFTGPTEGPALDPFPDAGGDGSPKPESEWTEEEKKAVERQSLMDTYPDLAILMKRDGISYSNIQWAAARKGHQPPDLPIELYPEAYVDRLIRGWDKFVTFIKNNA